MNRKQLIVTHAAVFSVGIAAAMVMNGFRDPASGSPDQGDAPRTTSSHRTLGTGSDSSTSAAGKRASRDEGHGLSARDARPLSEKAESIARISDALDRQRALLELLDTLGPDQFAAFAEQYRNLNHFGDARGEFDTILRSWAKVDPLAALDYVGKNGGSRYARDSVLTTWAGSDPAAAERWAIENHEGDGPNPYMASVIRGVAANDLPKATELALAMPRSRERGDAVSAIADALLMQGTDAALAYPASITGDDALRGGFVETIADRLARKDPDRLATWLAGMDSGEVQNRASRRIADALAQEDLAKASAWVGTLKPEAQAEAARGVIPLMSSNDIAGTARWVSGLVGTPGYDRVVEEFVWSCDQRAPEQSAAWIQGVSDPNQQRRLYHRMLGGWAQRDAAAVRQWVTTNNVPDDVRQRFSR